VASATEVKARLIECLRELHLPTFREGFEDLARPETRFQPPPQHLLVHGDVRQQPFMADSIKASFDVPFQDPLWTVPIAQYDVRLIQGVGTAAFQSKAIGMAVGLRFRDRIETEQV